VQVGGAGAAVRDTSGRTASVSLFWTERVSWPLGLHCPISQSTVKARSVFNEDVKAITPLKRSANATCINKHSVYHSKLVFLCLN